MSTSIWRRIATRRAATRITNELSGKKSQEIPCEGRSAPLQSGEERKGTLYNTRGPCGILVDGHKSFLQLT